jgi:glycosyltransferase involved in cell wall biosynthesis
MNYNKVQTANKMKKKILVISHDDSRSGAPILLLNLAEVILFENPQIEIEFLIKSCRFQIIDRFKKLGKTYILHKNEPEGFSSRILNKIYKKRLINRMERKIIKLNLNNFDLILSNTITNGDILPMIRRNYKGVIVSYIHELLMSTRIATNQNLVTDLIHSSDFFAYPCQTVKEYLKSTFSIKDESFVYLPYYIAPTVKQFTPKNKKEFVVGASGTTNWRKGFDLFIQVALLVKEKDPLSEFKFIWKGAFEGIILDKARYDLKKSGLINSVEIQMSGDNMDCFWQSVDLFILTSREDPYPLVVLEAANYEIPVIAFNDAGGANEFISSDSGLIVPYLSVNNMSDAILDLNQNKEKIINLGINASDKLKKSHSNRKFVYSHFDYILCKSNNKIKVI